MDSELISITEIKTRPTEFKTKPTEFKAPLEIVVDQRVLVPVYPKCRPKQPKLKKIKMKKITLAIGFCCSILVGKAQFTSPGPGIQSTLDDVGIGTTAPLDALHLRSGSPMALRVGYISGGFDYYSRLLDDGIEWYKQAYGGGIPQRMAYTEVDFSTGDFLLSAQGDVEMSMSSELKFKSFTSNSNMRYEMGHNVFKMIAGETGQEMDLELIARDDIYLRADGIVKITAPEDIEMNADNYRFQSGGAANLFLELDFNNGYPNFIVDETWLKFSSSTSNSNMRFENGHDVFKMIAGETGQNMDLELIATDDLSLRADEHIVLDPASNFKVILDDRAFGGDINNDAMFITGDGRVGMGIDNLTDPDDMPAGYRLYVTEGILAERVKVALSTTTDWADYVFADDYELMPLAEVAKFVEKEHHLPNVPSAEEVVEKGIDVAKMDALLLEKIEELTLYIIDQNKRIGDLEDQLNNAD